MSGWLGKLAQAAEVTNSKPKRSCILLWMSGGPSTIDMWDLKPDHENGGPYKTNQHHSTRIADWRTPAAFLGNAQPPRHSPWHVHQGRRSRPRNVLNADRSIAKCSRHSVPEHRGTGLERTRRCQGRIAYASALDHNDSSREAFISSSGRSMLLSLLVKTRISTIQTVTASMRSSRLPTWNDPGSSINRLPLSVSTCFAICRMSLHRL